MPVPVRCTGRANVNAVATNYGQSILHLVCRGNQDGPIDLVHYLVDTCHLDNQTVDSLGQTALHVACHRRHLGVVLYLMQRYPVSDL